jgi:hypothetical protein
MSSVDSRHSLIEEGHRFRPKAVPFFFARASPHIGASRDLKMFYWRIIRLSAGLSW